MNSRVERYRYEEENNIPSRSEKNKELYNTLDLNDFSKYRPDNNVRVLNSQGKSIDIEKIKKYVMSQEESTDKKIENIVVNKKAERHIIAPEEEKEYDINSVLEKAKAGRELYYEDEKYKKLRDTQYDILNSLNIDSSETDYDSMDFNTEEQTLIDLINTVSIQKSKDNNKEIDMFDELKGPASEEKTNPITEENNIITKEIKEEINNAQKEEADSDKKNGFLNNMDNSFYTNSMTFGKSDFEGFEELEKNVRKNNVLMKLGIFLLIILLIVTVFVILKYVLNIF